MNSPACFCGSVKWSRKEERTTILDTGQEIAGTEEFRCLACGRKAPKATEAKLRELIKD